jgi:hypothetical protein
MRSIIKSFAALWLAIACAASAIAAPGGPPASQGLAAQAKAAAAALNPGNLAGATSYGSTDVVSCSQSGIMRACTPGRSARLGVGFAAPTVMIPSIQSFAIAPPGSGFTATNPDFVAQQRQTVWSGDWTTRATVTVPAAVTGGSSVWSLNGKSVTIAWNAAAADVQTTLNGALGANMFAVTGGPGGSSPYVVTYSLAFMVANNFQALTIDSSGLTGGAATIVWTNQWGVDTGFVFGGNGYHVTGTTSGDGNNIAALYGDLSEADLRSDANVGKILGFSAEAAFAGANASGHALSMTGMLVKSGFKKDGAPRPTGIADSVVGLDVLGVQAARSFTDGQTKSDATITSATAQFAIADVGKLVTGAGVPAGTYIVSLASATVANLNQATTASATGVTIALAGTAQCTTCLTARFQTGAVSFNGQVSVQGSRDEATFRLSGANNQTGNLFELWNNSFANRVLRITTVGNLSANGSLTLYEGNALQTSIGYTNGPGKAGLALGYPFDTGLYRDTVGVVAFGGGLRLGANVDPGVANAIPSAAGARLFSGSGAPGTVRGAASGDLYFRYDAPQAYNQRLYFNVGGTWEPTVLLRGYASGSATTGADGTIAVTFGTAMTLAPVVTLAPIAASGFPASCALSAAPTSAGFTIRCVAGGSTTQTAAASVVVDWQASVPAN